MVGIFSLKFLGGLLKYVPDPDVISKFSELHGARYNVRNKADQVLFGYLSDIQIVLPLAAKKKLYLKMMKILGYFFYISICILTFLLFLYFYLFNRISN
jgi:hypothetical protein